MRLIVLLAVVRVHYEFEELVSGCISILELICHGISQPNLGFDFLEHPLDDLYIFLVHPMADLLDESLTLDVRNGIFSSDVIIVNAFLAESIQLIVTLLSARVVNFIKTLHCEGWELLILTVGIVVHSSPSSSHHHDHELLLIITETIWEVL